MTQQQIKAEWIRRLPADTRIKLTDLLCDVMLLRECQTIFPAQENILNAISHVTPENIKVVILGQDPYHERHQAMGLSFSVQKGTPMPPSLLNIFKELHDDLGVPIPNHGDLTKWAKQGVLLLNTVLTVKEHRANSHADLGWQDITKEILQICLDTPQPVVFLLWGRQAQNTMKTCNDENSRLKFALTSTHPSPFSADRATGATKAFLGSRPFSRTNQILVAHGAEPIDWSIN